MCLATEPHGKAVSFQYKDYVLTHLLTACGPVPTALDPNGVYPYVSYCETANRPVPQKYTFIVLENGHIKVTISPDIGGKVTPSFTKNRVRRSCMFPKSYVRHGSCLDSILRRVEFK